MQKCEIFIINVCKLFNMSKSDNTQINGEKDIALNLTVALYVYFRSNENNNMRNISHFNDSLCRF